MGGLSVAILSLNVTPEPLFLLLVHQRMDILAGLKPFHRVALMAAEDEF